jgi:beta-glucosidase
MTFTFQSPALLPYKDASLSVDERVADLLKRMTLDEKVAQLTCLWPQGRDIPPDALKNGTPFRSG